MNFDSVKRVIRSDQKVSDKQTIETTINLSPTIEDFITKMECDTQFDPTDPTQDQNKKCNNREVITSLQKNGICFTYFHKMAKYTKIDDRSECEMLETCGQFWVIFKKKIIYLKFLFFR
jgi:hypothetical protein